MPPWFASQTPQVQPFLRWPGGKRWAVSQLLPWVRRLLAEDGRYFEPFLGGGAVFFALGPKRATLGDINGDLIDTYRSVRRFPHRLRQAIRELSVCRRVFDRQRQAKPRTGFGKAVRLLYLNRVAFSGLYRVNRKGEFNVPFDGSRGTDLLWRSDVLTAASQVLEKTSLCSQDFEATMSDSGRGDLVYCDPAYTVSHNNNCFVRYNESNFSWDDQVRLAKAASQAVSRGASVLVTNADHRSIRELYADWPVVSLRRQTRLAPDPEKRGATTEALVVLTPKNRLDAVRSAGKRRRGEGG